MIYQELESAYSSPYTFIQYKYSTFFSICEVDFIFFIRKSYTGKIFDTAASTFFCPETKEGKSSPLLCRDFLGHDTSRGGSSFYSQHDFGESF